MGDRRKMSTVSVYSDTLPRLNMLRKPKKSRIKYESHMELLADVVERAVEALEREQEIKGETGLEEVSDH